jgi:hypothetical protein
MSIGRAAPRSRKFITNDTAIHNVSGQFAGSRYGLVLARTYNKMLVRIIVSWDVSTVGFLGVILRLWQYIDYVGVLISLWLFLFLIFLFAAQAKEFFLDWLNKLEQRSHKCVELRGEYVE